MSSQLTLNILLVTLVTVSSNSFAGNMNTNETAINTTITYTNAQEGRNNLFDYTIKPPYLFISISILSATVICSIICCFFLFNRYKKLSRKLSSPPRRLSAPPEPFEFALTIPGNSLHGHNKKHSLKIVTALTPVTPDDSNKEEFKVDTNMQKEEEMQEQMEEQTNTKTTAIRIPESTKEKTTTELRNEFMSFSSRREYENEWYDGTLVHSYGAGGALMGQTNEFNETNEETVTEHLRKEMGTQVQNRNTNAIENTHTETTQHIYEIDSSNEITSCSRMNEYEWITKTLIEIDEENSEEIINIFKQNKVTDGRLSDLRENDWRDLIPAIGIRNEFKKMYQKTISM